jgi:hypothetical protein
LNFERFATPRDCMSVLPVSDRLERSEHSSLESQGFAGLMPGMPIIMIDDFCCSVVIVGRS